MQIDAIRFRLRPRTTFEILDLALVMVRHKLSGYLVIGLAVMVPLALLNWALLTALQWPASAAILLLMLEAPLLGVPLVIFSADLVFDEEPDALGSLRRALTALPALLIEFMLIRVLLYLLPLGFLIYLFRYRFSTEVTVLEQLSGARKRDRLRFLQAHDQHGAVLSLMLLLIGVLAIFGMFYSYAWIISTLLGDFSFSAIELPMPNLAIIHGVALAILGYWYVVFFLDYIDVRTAREGWDLSLELRMASQS